MKFFEPPFRNYIVVTLILIGFLLSWFNSDFDKLILFVSILGSISIVKKAFNDLLIERKISIEVFNSFVLVVAFLAKDTSTAGFIVLMLTFADYLDWKIQTKSNNAVEELLKLNPQNALIEVNSEIKEVEIEKIKENDILVIENGSRVPVDGVVVFGKALLNEASVSGESVPVEKITGDIVFSSTLNESGLIKIKATGVGKNSTIQRMVELIRRASFHKSHGEKMADNFAEIFLPILLVVGVITYFFTKNIAMVMSLFLVACADDLAVAIPLAMTASLGQAAKRGVIVKGGEWFDALANMKSLVFDKTGTLTYGSLKLESVHIEKGIEDDFFWKNIAVAEKFSEHPVGRAMFREAIKFLGKVEDPDEFKVVGGGVYAKHNNNEILIGNEKIFDFFNIKLDEKATKVLLGERDEHRNTTSIVYINKKFSGVVTIADILNPDAKKSIKDIKELGIKDVLMFTGDNEEIAREVSLNLGIDKFKFKMTPEEKLSELEKISNTKIVGMVGDGINDAPSLARANVGIAMGGSGTDVAIEAADVIIISNKLDRIPEIIKLSKKTLSVVKMNIVIWIITNTVGFTLVFMGYIDPMLAAFYNFVTDFLPLFNSARLFSTNKINNT